MRYNLLGNKKKAIRYVEIVKKKNTRPTHRIHDLFKRDTTTTATVSPMFKSTCCLIH